MHFINQGSVIALPAPKVSRTTPLIALLPNIEFTTSSVIPGNIFKTATPVNQLVFIDKLLLTLLGNIAEWLYCISMPASANAG